MMYFEEEEAEKRRGMEKSFLSAPPEHIQQDSPPLPPPHLFK